jgi:hypothetical protein
MISGYALTVDSIYFCASVMIIINKINQIIKKIPEKLRVFASETAGGTYNRNSVQRRACSGYLKEFESEKREIIVDQGIMMSGYQYIYPHCFASLNKTWGHEKNEKQTQCGIG